MKEFKAYDLSAESFEGYGYVISQQYGEPLADNEAFTYWDKIAELEIETPISTGIVEGHQEDFTVNVVERHVETPEILVALSGDFVALLGKPDNSTGEVKELKAFYVKQGEAIALSKGTWHSPPIAVEERCKALVIFKSGTPDNDLEEVELEEEAEIKVE